MNRVEGTSRLSVDRSSCVQIGTTPDEDDCGGESHSDGGCYHRHTPEAGDDIRHNLDHTSNSIGDDESDYDISLDVILYGASSYHAIVKPVSLTMMLAALVAVNINTEESLIMGEKELASAYQVWKLDDNVEGEGGAGATLVRSLGNAVVMVSVLCAMTFGIVILYKKRFMKCLIGYMIFTSATLLGVMGSVMLDIAIDKYHIPIDVISYYFGLWNFAAVGTISIFWQIGVPSYITQGYLVATSVILAWHLSHFDEWTAWTLLVMLALYDLCAVLTPCGPLKALVNAMQEDDAPDMPGLLYEAQLEGGSAAMRHPKENISSTSGDRFVSSVSKSASSQSENTRGAARVEPTSDPTNSSPLSRTDKKETCTISQNVELKSTSETSAQLLSDRVVIVPFAIAKIYNLPLISPSIFDSGSVTRSKRSRGPKFEKGSNVDPSSLLDDSSKECQPQQLSYEGTYTPEQLKAQVHAQLPKNGGRIETRVGEDGEVRYAVRDKNGEEKRILFVNCQGEVFEVLDDDDDDGSDDSEEDHDGTFNNSIRLGLGDFIFYSVLVAKAALYGFTTFASCMLVILAGLGVTLVLLAVYHHALPALPVSIFLGVIFYILTRLSIEPWVQFIMRAPLYV